MTELCRPAWIRRLVFTLILAATAFFVAYWTGFRAGHQTGYSSGSRVGSDADYIRREYPVADLVLQAHQSGDYASDVDSLKYLIMSIVSPSDWDLVGGRGCVEVQPPSLTLNVFQSDANHREIEELLASMRESRVPRRSNGQETQ